MNLDFLKMKEQMTTQANEQLDTLKAVKGEKFARAVTEFLHVRSMGTIINASIDDSNMMGKLAVQMLSQLQGLYMSKVSDELGIQMSEFAEVVEWADLIHDGSKRIVQAELQTAKD